MDLERFLILSAVIFAIGLYGALSRRNAITVLMSLELMFIGVMLAAAAMSRYVASRAALIDAGTASAASEATLQTLLTGQVFALFIIAPAIRLTLPTPT